MYFDNVSFIDRCVQIQIQSSRSSELKRFKSQMKADNEFTKNVYVKEMTAIVRVKLKCNDSVYLYMHVNYTELYFERNL